MSVITKSVLHLFNSVDVYDVLSNSYFLFSKYNSMQRPQLQFLKIM